MSAEPGDNDPLLAPLIAAATDEARRERTADLMAEHALPLVDAILASRLQRIGPGADAALEDLRGDVVVRLLHRLQRLVADPAGAAIHSFRDYAAVVAYHRFDDFVRQSQPARAALGNRIRYLLTKDPELALWSRQGELLAGLAQWREEDRAPVPVGQVPALHGIEAPPHCDSPRELRALLERTFALLGGPVEVGALVSLLASLLRVGERSVAWISPPPEGSGDPGPLAQLETQDYLRRLWVEITALPVRQRIALLLSIRDARGDSVARLLPATGIASVAEIARILELDATLFAALWAELPVEDARIAELLGLARQQIINLRKSARERLARRMARLG